MDLLKSFDRHFEIDDRTSMLPIVEFAEKWCGMNLLLWQRVVAKMYAGEDLSDVVEPGYRISEKEWFDKQIDQGRMPPDTRKKIRKHGMNGFKSILLVVGRRGGKSTVIAVCALYTVYKVLRHDNPQRHYGIQENDIIQIAVAATSAAQSERSPFMKVQAICKKAMTDKLPLADWIEENGLKTKVIYFQTVNDKRVARELSNRGVIGGRTSTVQVHSYHSNVDTLRGGAIIAAIFDEFASFQVTQKGLDSAEYFYNSLVPSTIQFGDDGRTFILSTPKGEIGKFFDIYREAWKGARQSTIAIKMPSWEAWEDEPPERAEQGITRRKLSDAEDVDFHWDYAVESFEEAWMRTPSAVKQEWGAEFVGADEQWLPSILIVHPDGKGVQRKELRHNTMGTIGRLYTCHVDAATKTDAFALAVLHRERDENNRDIIVVDHAVRWYVAPSPIYEERPYEFLIRQKGPEPALISFNTIEEYIKHNILKRFNVQFLSFDQHQSSQMAERLSEWIFENEIRTTIKVVNFTKPFNTERANKFETLVLEGRFRSYPHPILEEELRGLTKDNLGRVEKGPVTTDDLYDCVSAAALHALELPADADTSFRNFMYGVDPTFPSTRM